MRVSIFEVFILFIVAALSTANTQDVNIALNKPVYGKGIGLSHVNDGNFRSTIEPDAEYYAFFVIDLKDIYEISSIRLYAQNENRLRERGLQVPFSVYTLDTYTSRFDFMQHYPWKIAKSKLVFYEKGQRITVDGSFTAQYIIVMPDKDERRPYEAYGGILMGEIEIYGKKIHDGYVSMEPKNNDCEASNYYYDVRKAILSGMDRYWVQQQYGEFVPNNDFKDVVLGWHHERINTLAAVRGKGRILAWAGPQGPQRLLTLDNYKPMRENVRQWLRPDRTDSKFVQISHGISDGDILIIERKDKFDYQQVANLIREGRNALIIGYLGGKTEGSDDATKLLKELNIGYKIHGGQYMGRDIPVADKLNSPLYVPLTYRFELARKCWSYFKNNDLHSDLNPDDLEKPDAQQALRELIDEYEPYFISKAICTSQVYTKTDETFIAMLNYNNLLGYLSGSKTKILPGIYSTPGGMLPMEKATAYTVTLNVDVQGNFFPLGSYAKPGEAVRYRVLKCSDPHLNGLYLRISPQTDYLTNFESSRRWMRVSFAKKLQQEGIMASPAGGLVMLQIPANTNITIRVENVYRHPWFDIRDPKSVAEWDQERKKYLTIPYTAIVGDRMISVILTSDIVKVSRSDMKWAVTYNDNVIKMMHNYRGTDWRKHRMEVFVTDEQISVGWGHSGYPFMGHNGWSCAFTQVPRIKKGDLTGMIHELGHNLQVEPCTLRNGEEVTNNIYIPLAHKHLLNLSKFNYNTDVMVNQWTSGEYNGVTLDFYNYLQHLFSEGLVGNVFQNGLRTQERLNSDEEKVNFWVRNMCTESKLDLVPFHRLWHFDISEEVKAQCAQYPCFLPDDEVTRRAPAEIERVLKELGKSCSRVKPAPIRFKGDLHDGFYKLDKQFIFFNE